MAYAPTFQITGRIVHLVADIAMMTERYVIQMERAHQDLSVTQTEVTDVTDHVTDIQQKILEAIRQNPRITQVAIAESIGVSRVHVSRNMRVLQTMGIIRRVGSDRSGYWEIQ